jgi:hypothetical protein
MRRHLQHGQQSGRIPKLRALGGQEPERGSEELENGLRMFGESLRAAAEKPDAFWTNQHTRIAAKLQHPVPVFGRRPALVWAPAVIMVVLCLFLFVQSSNAPTPDFATGYDQNLLIEVEKALDQDCPDALAPAALINKEIDQAWERQRPAGIWEERAGETPALPGAVVDK